MGVQERSCGTRDTTAMRHSLRTHDHVGRTNRIWQRAVRPLRGSSCGYADLFHHASLRPLYGHGEERGRSPLRVSGEAVGCPVRTTKEDAPDGRILRSASALTGQTSYISPEPKRCVERKVLNCRHVFYQIPGMLCTPNRNNFALTDKPRAFFREQGHS